MRKRQRLAKQLFSVKGVTVYTIRGPKSHRPIVVVVSKLDAFTRSKDALLQHPVVRSETRLN